jgi:hypothetical protein
MSSISFGASTRPFNHIGFDGQLDFGVGICPAVPAGYTPHPSWYGNYVFTDGSVMVWIPAFYCRIGHVNNPTYARWLLNSVDVQPISAFANLAAANAAGYFLPRMFYNAGQVQLGKFIDKFGCSNNSGTASSLQNGNPLSTASAHNPIGALTGAPANNYGGVFAAAKTRGAKFHPMMRYDRTALALLAMAQAQAATSTAACAWWDGTSTGAMGPRGNTNNAFGDSNDAAVSYVGDDYQNCGKTGSGVPFAKTTHNGCDSGVCDLTGNMWEVSPGVTCVTTSGAITAITQANPAVVTQAGHGRTTGSVCRIDGGQMTQANNKHFTITVIDANSYSLGVDSTTWTAYTSGATAVHGTFHALALSADAAALTGGNTLATDAWGATGLAAHSQVVPVNFGAGLGFDLRYGNAANQVISGAVSGNAWMAASLGFVASGAALGTSGIAAFGQDYFYAYLQNELCPLAGGAWGFGSTAGAWAVAWGSARSYSHDYVGFRAASYL